MGNHLVTNVTKCLSDPEILAWCLTKSRQEGPLSHRTLQRWCPGTGYFLFCRVPVRQSYMDLHFGWEILGPAHYHSPTLSERGSQSYKEALDCVDCRLLVLTSWTPSLENLVSVSWVGLSLWSAYVLQSVLRDLVWWVQLYSWDEQWQLSNQKYSNEYNGPLWKVAFPFIWWEVEQSIFLFHVHLLVCFSEPYTLAGIRTWDFPELSFILQLQTMCWDVTSDKGDRNGFSNCSGFQNLRLSQMNFWVKGALLVLLK